LNELMQLIKLDYIARAPDGFEVEELTRKQMVKVLQNKRAPKKLKDLKNGITKEKEHSSKGNALQKFLKKMKVKDDSEIMEIIKSIEIGHSIGLNKNFDKLFDLPVGEIFGKIRSFKDTFYLIIDGILTKRLLSLSIKMKIKFIACKNKEEELIVPDSIIVFNF
ncbi:MAG: hypothetical protein KAX18_10280, partial [Candidatus Lokiarchaeota archaeon]|nr:hypothetical protein [Candidatus Lokiarchaeota archaeon]